ncbi:MAG: DUF2177 family protein [Bdellovibrionota bacterium]
MNWKVFLVVLSSLAIFDFVWLGFVTHKTYVSQLEPILRLKDGRIDVVYWAGALVYVLLALGVAMFVIPKLTVADSLATAFFYGGVLGLIVYGVYDFTNVAILKDWSLLITAIDIAWGVVSVGTATALGHWVQSNVLN